MPPDGVIQIAFDRYLLPVSVTRQSVILVDGSNNPLPADQAPNVIYDPIARTVTLARQHAGPWLTPGQPYKLAFPIPKSLDDVSGLRAIDGATLAPDQVREIAFNVASETTPTDAGSTDAGADAAGDDGGAEAGPPTPFGEPVNVSFCHDVLPILSIKCGGGNCHGPAPTAAASLVLTTASGIANTARNRVAQGSNRGGVAGHPSSEGARFGIDMPIIAVDDAAHVGSPGNSWIMYKLDLAVPPNPPSPRPPIRCDFETSDPTPSQEIPFTALAPIRASADDVERGILSNFILGREMPFPYPGTEWGSMPLTFQERETIRMWIARGAGVLECGECNEVPATDGGASDAATDAASEASSDAGADAGDAGDGG